MFVISDTQPWSQDCSMETEKTKNPDAPPHNRNWAAGDLLMAFAFIVFAVLMFIGAYHFPWRARIGIVTSAGFVPILLSVLIIILSLALIISTLRKYGRVSFPEWFSTTVADERTRRSFTIILITFVYILSIGKINFLAANILYLIVMFRYLKVGNWIRTILYGVMNGIFVAVIVPYIFQMPLP